MFSIFVFSEIPTPRNETNLYPPDSALTDEAETKPTSDKTKDNLPNNGILSPIKEDSKPVKRKENSTAVRTDGKVQTENIETEVKNATLTENPAVIEPSTMIAESKAEADLKDTAKVNGETNKKVPDENPKTPLLGKPYAKENHGKNVVVALQKNDIPPGLESERVVCPKCNREVDAEVTRKPSEFAWACCVCMALLLLWPFCLIPLFMKSCKRTYHTCSVCQYRFKSPK